MSTAVMPQNAMYEFGDIIIKVGGCFCVVFVLCSAANLLLLPPTGREPALRRCQTFLVLVDYRKKKGARCKTVCSDCRGHWVRYIIARKITPPQCSGRELFENLNLKIIE